MNNNQLVTEIKRVEIITVVAAENNIIPWFNHPEIISPFQSVVGLKVEQQNFNSLESLANGTCSRFNSPGQDE